MTTLSGALILVATFGLSITPRAPAQQPFRPVSHDTLAAALEPLKPGTTVRIRIRDGQVRTGNLTVVAADTVYLKDGSVIPFGEIDSLWRGKPGTLKGARAGAIAGGAGGAVALGLLSAALVEGLCETDDCNPGAAALLGGLVGGAAGALAGVGIGALLGASVTSWEPTYPRPAGTARAFPARGPPRLSIQPFALYIAPIDLEGASGAGAGARVLAGVSSSVSLGAELGYFGLGEGLRPGVTFPDFPSPPLAAQVYRERSRHRVFSTHAALKYAIVVGAWSPYVVGTAGINWHRALLLEQVVCGACAPDLVRYPATSSLAFPGPGGSVTWRVPFGYTFGGGVEVPSPGSRPRFGFEARWHSRPDFITVGITLGLGV